MSLYEGVKCLTWWESITLNRFEPTVDPVRAIMPCTLLWDRDICSKIQFTNIYCFLYVNKFPFSTLFQDISHVFVYRASFALSTAEFIQTHFVIYTTLKSAAQKYHIYLYIINITPVFIYFPYTCLVIWAITRLRRSQAPLHYQPYKFRLAKHASRFFIFFYVVKV